MSAGAKDSGLLKGSREDEDLVHECLLGSEEAWSALIDKYKNLIFSIPVRSGLSTDDAAEIFQEVCVTLLHKLPCLREPRALAAWLINVTSHKCTHWRNEQRMHAGVNLIGEMIPETASLPDELLEDVEREQFLREALTGISPECKRLVEMLFLRDPPISYDRAAHALGLAKGSMGATRMRCLDKLRRSLQKKGFRR